MKKLLLILIMLFLIPLVSAQSFQKPINYASDFANIIDPEWEAAINTLGAEIERNSSSQVFVATIEDTTPYVAKEYATRLFDEWDIGQKGKDNGVLILLAFKPERRIEIETGYGVEGILPDSKVGNIRREFTSLLTESKYGEGLFKIANAIGDAISGSGEFSGSDQSNTTDNFSDIIFFAILILVFIFIFAGAYKRKPKCPTCKIKMKVDKKTVDDYYIVYEFVCPKCGKKTKKKVSRSRSAGFIIVGGGFGGGSSGGFGGGGGGGSGGGGSGGGF